MRQFLLACLLMGFFLAGMTSVHAVILKPGDIVVADAIGSVVLVDPATGAQTLVASGGLLDACIDVAVAPGSELWVVGGNNGLVRVTPGTSAQIALATSAPVVPATVAMEASGDLIVVESDGDLYRVAPARVQGPVILDTARPLYNLHYLNELGSPRFPNQRKSSEALMHRKIALSRGRKHRFHLRVERHDWSPMRMQDAFSSVLGSGQSGPDQSVQNRWTTWPVPTSR